MATHIELLDTVAVREDIPALGLTAGELGGSGRPRGSARVRRPVITVQTSARDCHGARHGVRHGAYREALAR